MKIVIAGLKGRTNSAKLLLDQFPAFHNIYLQNSRENSVVQLLPALQDADYIFAIGKSRSFGIKYILSSVQLSIISAMKQTIRSLTF